MPGRIQISQGTADALAAQGKGAWFVPRENKVQAKGLGLVKTYWVHVEAVPNTTTRHSTTDASERLGAYASDSSNTLEEGANKFDEDNKGENGSPMGSLAEELMLEDQLHGFLKRSSPGSSSCNTASP
eukprot:scaffold34676_cov176-Amphora_coffeaeformis.AAC.7